MGYWIIEIKGTGAHHNADYPQDANKMAKEFVAKLKEAGHTVKEAYFIQTDTDFKPLIQRDYLGG